MLGKILDRLVSVVYPQACYVCSGPVESNDNGAVCENCWSATRIFDDSDALCEKCGAYSSNGPFPAGACGQCWDDKYDRAVAAGIYEKALAATIVSLKKKPYLHSRARRLVEDLTSRITSTDQVVVPVPLSKRRSFERGYNQAEFIARIVAEKLAIPMYPNALLRVGDTQMHRIGMDKKAREATVKNMFRVQTPRLIAGKNVLLVDDVFTSGSTASDCAKSLKKSGAAGVTVVTLARAVLYK